MASRSRLGMRGTCWLDMRLWVFIGLGERGGLAGFDKEFDEEPGSRSDIVVIRIFRGVRH